MKKSGALPLARSNWFKFDDDNSWSQPAMLQLSDRFRRPSGESRGGLHYPAKVKWRKAEAETLELEAGKPFDVKNRERFVTFAE